LARQAPVAGRLILSGDISGHDAPLRGVRVIDLVSGPMRAVGNTSSISGRT